MARGVVTSQSVKLKAAQIQARRTKVARTVNYKLEKRLSSHVLSAISLEVAQLEHVCLIWRGQVMNLHVLL